MWSKRITLGAAVLVGAMAWIVMAPKGSTFGLFSADQAGRIITLVIGYFATATGAFLGAVYRDLRTRQRRGETHVESLSAFLSELLRSINLWLALTGSPIVFALVLKTTSGMGLSGIVVVALENGFSCLLVLDSLVADSSRQAKSRTAQQT